jgi:hypothetical protein
MRRHLKWIAVLILVSFFQLGIVLVQAQDIIPANAFLLRNRNDRQITFFLRKGAGDWTEYSLSAGGDGIFKNKDQIWIATKGQEPVHRSLQIGCRYKIVMKAGRWDVDGIGFCD